MAAAKLRYIEGYVAPDAAENAPPRFESLRDLSAATGVPLRTMETHSVLEGWTDLRSDFQAGVAAKASTITTRRLAMAQAATREEIHTGARLAVRKAVEKLRDQTLPMADIVGATMAFRRALQVTTEAADPEAGKGLLPGGAVGGARWMLLCAGLDPVEDADVLDLIPEEAED